jgi:competence protein ComEC
VVGQRDFVDPSTSDQLLVTGTAHLLSVSGLHLAIVVLLARYVGVWLRFPTSVQVLQILTVGILYAAITGGNPPVIRAAVLVGLFVLSTLLRRPSQPINTLAFAALLLLGWQPSLLFNVGVQLSFLAVATLMLCGRSCPDAESTLEEFRDRDERLRELADQSMGWLWRRGLAASMWLRQGIWYSGCVTTIGLPLVWHQFHVVSPISVLTNVCLSIPLTIALASGIFTVLLGGIWPALGSLPGVICHASLVVILELIQFFAGLPYGHVWLPAPPTWLVILFYVGILVSLVIPETKWSRRARFAGIGIWIVIAWIVATRPTALREGVIEATFVNVGHGTGVVLRFADDQVWLYDCGRLGNTPTSSAGVDAVLWSLGVSHLQGIMISHADIDHYNGIPAILTRFRVDRLYSPAGVLANTDPNMVSLQTQIDRLGIPYQPLHTGASIEVGKFKMLIQHPPTERCAGSDNANSLVVTIHGTGVPLILPGDLEPPGLDLLLNQERPRAGGVLMAPHHGSLQLDARSILDWSRASVVIVSGGQRTENPEVSASLSVTGAQVLVTHQAGAIRVRLASDGTVETKSWNSDSWRN